VRRHLAFADQGQVALHPWVHQKLLAGAGQRTTAWISASTKFSCTGWSPRGCALTGAGAATGAVGHLVLDVAWARFALAIQRAPLRRVSASGWPSSLSTSNGGFGGVLLHALNASNNSGATLRKGAD
jgi:hypothetical protein